MRLNLNFPAKPLAVLLALFSVCLFAPGVSAQTHGTAHKTNTPPAGGNRFLFIVDTSASMKSSAGEVMRTVDDIIRSSASGQLHSGDTLGLWTFNRELYAGFLPLQTWAPEDANEIALRTLEFLRQQHYGKESHFNKALEGMYTVIKNSDIITVFIISNGQSPMQGTPFDQQINALYVESLKEMKKDRKPVVTVLQAKRGRIIKYTVNALPWPVVIPEVPIPIKLAGAAAAAPPINTLTNGASPAPAPAPKPPPPAVAQNPAPPAATSAPATVVATPTAPLPVRPQSAPPVTVREPAIHALPPPAVAQNPVPPVAAPAPARQPAPPAVAQHLPLPNPGAPVKLASLPPPPRVLPAPITNKTIPPRSQPLVNDGEPARVSPLAKLPRHTNAPAIAEPNSSAPTNTFAARVMAVTMGQPRVLLLGALATAALGFALIGLLIYRSRKPSGPSLITRTMGNPPKK